MVAMALGLVPGRLHGATLSCLRLRHLLIEALWGEGWYSLWAGAPQSRLGHDASSFRTRGVCTGDVVF